MVPRVGDHGRGGGEDEDIFPSEIPYPPLAPHLLSKHIIIIQLIRYPFPHPACNFFFPQFIPHCEKSGGISATNNHLTLKSVCSNQKFNQNWWDLTAGDGHSFFRHIQKDTYSIVLFLQTHFPSLSILRKIWKVKWFLENQSFNYCT